jgi:PAS domain S-box-containing protein
VKLAVGATDASGNTVGTAAHECPLGPANSLAGHAIAAGHPITTTDLAADARFSDRFLSRMGVASALAVPLHARRKAVAALCVYRKTKQEFTLDDVRFAETIGHLASVSLAQAKYEEELRQLRSLASAVLETVDSLVLTLDGNGNIVDMNGLCEQLSEYSLDEICGRPFWSALVAGEEAEAVEAVFRDAFAGDLPQGFEADLAAKHGRRHRIGWSWRILFSEQGEADRLVLAGTQCGSRPAHDEKEGEPHRPFQPVGKKAAPDLRRSPRRSFHYIQRIAPTSGEGLPSKNRFIEVRCEDISAGGIAFYLGRRPDFTTLVVTLGRPPAESHFSARVVRVVKATLEGRGVYLVGCRFTGRVSI